MLVPINNNGAKSKIEIEEVPEKTTKIWYFKSNDALNNLLDDSKGGFTQVIFNAACCFHNWRSPAARQEDNNLAHNEYIKDIFLNPRKVTNRRGI